MDEWKTDEFGRKYRLIGNIKEYEMLVQTSNGIVPESHLSEHNARMRATQQEITQKIHGRCPFADGLKNECRSDCALYTERGCKVINKSLKTETVGKHCPFSPYPCTNDCRLYNEGCTI